MAGTLTATFPISGDISTLLVAKRERELSRLLVAYIASGICFMLLPGTFLGVLNLLSIAGRHGSAGLSPAWIQAHGHAQVFGWIGTFIIGIGFYSIPKMSGSGLPVIHRGWAALLLWSTGVALRWLSNVYLWHWRTLLPLSALLELAAFLLFLRAVGRHKGGPSTSESAALPIWIACVYAGTVGFLLTLLANFGSAAFVALYTDSPALPHWLDSRFLLLATFGFIVPTIWGFSARWLPIFLGLDQPCRRGLTLALVINSLGIVLGLAGLTREAAVLVLLACVISLCALRVTTRALRPAKIIGVHKTFPVFARVAYAWLGIACILQVIAAWFDHNNGFWGASRHALTVGFIALMVFTIGARILPAFFGMKLLFSPRMLAWSSGLLVTGCVLRVVGQSLAYEGLANTWHSLPVSAVLELTAVMLFATVMVFTALQPPAHEKKLAAA
jgi:uncharacterized protein involved in response to NO